MSLQSLKNLHLLKIKMFSDVNIFIDLIINLILFSLSFFYLINISFFKNNISFIYIFTNSNILFIIITNKYKLYINKIIFNFLQ